MVFGSFMIAGMIWFWHDFSLLFYFQGEFERIALVSVVCLICLYYFDFYATGIMTNDFEVVTRLIQVLGTTCLIVGLLYYLFPLTRLGIGFLGLGLVLVGVCLSGSRKLFSALSSSMPISIRSSPSG